uniref:Uncharacterized protein n=1 Tax=Hyaloperonospora arabidopsidis (strain Emoy2) TaxID=559515 RepID=M4BG28_HYAAE
MNRLNDILTPDCNDQVIKVTVITRSTTRRRESPTIMQEEVVQNMRLDRINMRRTMLYANTIQIWKGRRQGMGRRITTYDYTVTREVFPKRATIYGEVCRL